MLQENTPGRDGGEYTLKCQLICDKLPRNQAIPPYNITFLFYNGKYLSGYQLLLDRSFLYVVFCGKGSVSISKHEALIYLFVLTA